MQTEAKTESLDPHRWVVFGVICSIYILVYFHRVTTSVIATDLLAAFQTDAAALGFMSSMYFYLYAVEQPLVGYLSDRLGPRPLDWPPPLDGLPWAARSLGLALAGSMFRDSKRSPSGSRERISAP